MSALPPSARDFLAYQRLVIDQASTRTVAGELKISQTRVRQVVRRVTDWLLQNLPPTDQNDQAALLRLAQHIAADRLERYLHEANEAWRQTMETRYASLTLRLLLAQSKFPALSGNLEALAMDAILGPLPDSSRHTPCAVSDLSNNSEVDEPTDGQSAIRNPQSAIPPPPPPRDSSPSPRKTPPTATANNTATTVTPSTATPSATAPPPTDATKRAFLAPAHSASSRHTPCAVAALADSPGITEFQLTPEKLGLTTQQHSSRKDRRRLRRLALAKK